MLTIGHRKQLHEGNVAQIKRTALRNDPLSVRLDSARLTGQSIGPISSTHGSPPMQMLVYATFFAFLVAAVCYFVFGGK